MAKVKLSSMLWWSQGYWSKSDIVCEKVTRPLIKGIWMDKNYIFQSHASVMPVLLCLFLISSTIVSYLLRPLRLPFVSPILAGVIIGSVMERLDSGPTALVMTPPINYTVKSFSFLGFAFHAFTLGVGTNWDAVRGISKQTLFIGYVGIATSLFFSFLGYLTIKPIMDPSLDMQGLISLSLFNCSTYFMVTCSHLNDLGLSSTKLGRFVSSISLVVSLSGTFVTTILSNIVVPIMNKGQHLWRPIAVIAYYLTIYLVFRPLIIYIVNKAPEGRSMKKSHFILILVLVLITAFLGEMVDERFSIFLFAFTIPQEPLASILSDRLDPITNGLFFPIFCVERGSKARLSTITKTAYQNEIVMLMGVLGKFIGTFIPSILVGQTFRHALAMTIIIGAKGLLDIAALQIWRIRGLMSEEQYTLGLFQVIFITSILLPLVTKYLYNSSRQYSSMKRRSIMDDNLFLEKGYLRTMTCIYKEDNLPGLLRLLEVFHGTRANPVSVLALQIFQLHGRSSMPVLGPLHQFSSSSTFKSNLTRCNLTVNAFLHLERLTQGYTRLQHYIAMSHYHSAHNEICDLAYEKGVGLIILPFHVTLEQSSSSIREVNKNVLERSPCSVGIAVDRGSWSQHRISDNTVHRVAMLFVGGADDREALGYSWIFANHPNVKLVVVRLKGPNQEEDFDENDDDKVTDRHFISKFQDKCSENDRISFREVVVNDGAETTKVVVSMKDVVDLVIVGKNHDPRAAPVFGLLINGYMEYPELGILGDVLASPDFHFSLFVVQREQQDYSAVDMEDL